MMSRFFLILALFSAALPVLAIETEEQLRKIMERLVKSFEEQRQKFQ